MKRLGSLITLLLAVSLPLFAEHVDPETARKVATTFLNNNGAKATQLIDLTKEAGFDNLFVFDANPGFVVMAADDCVKPILGYSLTGRFVAEGMPEHVASWIQGYSDEIQYAIDHQMRASSETAQLWKNLAEGNGKTGRANVVVSPLIQTKWNQNKYYNRQCPVASGGPDGHAFTGCVATAMAQIMNYWQYPSRGFGSYSYLWNGQTLSADFGATTYDWANMADYYEYYYSDPLGNATWLPSNFHTPERIDAVATLMYHCGVSVDMNYGGGSSGAPTNLVADALKTYFNYNPAVTFKQKTSNYGASVYYTDEEWIDMVKEELDAHRPLEYCGNHPTSSGGHAFVCDGYDDSDYFHFNWGWAGHYDGYFSLDNLDTGANSGEAGAGNGVYTRDQGAVFGIRPSNCTAEVPDNLTYTQNGRTVTFHWDTASGAASYNVYRDYNYIGNSATDFFVETAPYGTHVYTVRSVDGNGALSLSSNIVTVTVETVNDLQVTASGNQATLSWTAPKWCYPETSAGILTYGDGTFENNVGFLGTANMYWGHRYLADNLTSFSDMVICKLSFYSRVPGRYEYFIYKGTNNPNSQLAHGSFVVSINGWFEIALDENIEIDDSQDLWVFFYDPEAKDYPATFCNFTEHTEGCYYSNTDPLSAPLDTFDGTAWLIRTHLTDGTYTYNLYQDGTRIAQDLSATTYNAMLNHNAPNLFTVRTNYYGGVSASSNMVGVTMSEAELTSLGIASNDKITLTSGSSLTVTGEISNIDPANLIIEDGAQLIHPSSAVEATLKKSISGYGNDNTVKTGWYTIASPVDGFNTGIAITTTEYDLYAYDEPSHVWLNQKVPANNITSFAEGYGLLYANSSNQSLNFAGSMKATDDKITVPLSYSEAIGDLKGFNLMGNPFTRNLGSDDITIGGTSLLTYYVVEGGSELETRDIATYPIKPGQGFFVQATVQDQELVFNPSSKSGQDDHKPSFIRIEAGNDLFTDRAYVQLGEGNSLHKMTLRDDLPKVYVAHNESNYSAIVVDETTCEIPIHFKAAEDGSYTLSINAENTGLEYLHLIDNLTGADIDLMQSQSYAFEAKISDYESRFRLIFSASDNPNSTSTDLEGGITHVMDVTGRIVGTSIHENMKPGVYILRTVNGNEIKTEKIIIK